MTPHASPPLACAAAAEPLTARGVAGIHAAIVTPLRADLSVDADVLAAQLRRLGEVPGMRGVMCNGHAGENALTSRADKARVVAICRDAMPQGGLVIAGVNAEASHAAARQAEDAAAAGADAVMVFAPNGFALGQDRQMALTHHRIIAEATDLPLLLFQGAAGAGAYAYTADVLRDLIALPQVIGIKEGSWDSAAYEATRRLIKAERPELAVMASGDEHLLTCFILGSEGSVVSLAALIPEPIIALDRAVRARDHDAARAAHEVIYPLARAIYGRKPGNLATARLKTCMMLAGLLPDDRVHPPFGPLDQSERDALCDAMRVAGVL